MQTVRFENAQTIFQGLRFDDNMETEFVDKFDTGGQYTALQIKYTYNYLGFVEQNLSFGKYKNTPDRI